LITSGGQSALGAVEHANRAVVFIVDLIQRVTDGEVVWPPRP
jgi:hypothetical protein